MILLALACAVAAGYQITALLACLAHLRKHDPAPTSFPGVSILKPVYGADEAFDEAIYSHALLLYPEFEILFGVRDPNDTALPHIRNLMARFPALPVRIIHCTTEAANLKTGVLETLARQARYPIHVINDSDIHVEPDYLDRLTGHLEDPRVGLVTCLYGASASTFAGRFEALGISTDFAPGALVAPFAGVNEFGLGSTLAYRAADWQRAGGFAAIRDHLADDYQMGKRVSGLGLQVILARMPVATHLGGPSWAQVWAHQVRWARTIRLSRGLYYGLPVTYATLWALIALFAGWWHVAAGLLLLRMQVALLAGISILKDPLVERYWWLVPVRDLASVAVWAAGALGKDVVWRGRRLQLDREGRIVR